MPDPSAVVFVVDDDASVRRGLSRVIRSTGFAVETFASAQEFLEHPRPDVPGCLVLDLELPGLSGLDLQQRMVIGDIQIPVVFISGYGDISTSVRAMKAGALEFLTKPFCDQDLLDAIGRAIELDGAARQRRAVLEDMRRLVQSLTKRERQVMEHVVSGLLNKQIAAELGTSDIMIKVHRSRVMKKMRADSLADLVRTAERLGISRLTRR